jgi:hypothetical protein
LIRDIAGFFCLVDGRQAFSDRLVCDASFSTFFLMDGEIAGMISGNGRWFD